MQRGLEREEVQWKEVSVKSAFLHGYVEAGCGPLGTFFCKTLAA